jgi:hypothetical protein
MIQRACKSVLDVMTSGTCAPSHDDIVPVATWKAGMACHSPLQVCVEEQSTQAMLVEAL